jgi:hypothetical protein
LFKHRPPRAAVSFGIARIAAHLHAFHRCDFLAVPAILAYIPIPGPCASFSFRLLARWSNAMFSADRIFSNRNASTGRLEWYFSAREGDLGPYGSRDVAEEMSTAFVARCLAAGDDGGRSKKASPGLSLAPLDREAKIFEPGKPRKGKDNT